MIKDRLSSDSKFKSNLKIQNFSSVNIQLTFIVNADIKSIISQIGLIDQKMISISLTIASNFSSGCELLSDSRKQLIQISSKKLKHFIFPILPIKNSIKLSLLNSISNNILIKLVGNKLLAFAINSGIHRQVWCSLATFRIGKPINLSLIAVMDAIGFDRDELGTTSEFYCQVAFL